MSQLTGGRITGDIGFDQLTATGAERLSQSEDRGNDRSGGLAHKSEAVVEIERMRRSAVGERGLQRGSLESLTDYGGVLSGIFLARNLGANFCVLFLAAGKRYAKAVAHGNLRRLHAVSRESRVFQPRHKPGDFCGYVHEPSVKLFPESLLAKLRLSA